MILTELLLEIKEKFSLKDEINTNVSKSSVGWHLDHALKVVNTVAEKTINSNPDDYKKSFNIKRFILFKLEFFPRGKARAPKAVLPLDHISETEMEEQLQMVYSNLDKLKQLPENVFFHHHMFDMLDKKQTLHFLEIHTNHHLKIVKDILKK